MNIRPLNEEDYELLCSWWESWRKTPPDKDMLPDNGKGGFIVYDENVPVVAGFMYNTNSSLVWIEFIVSNIEYKNRRNRLIGIRMIDQAVSELAKRLEKKYVYSLLRKDSKILKNIGESQGYVINDERFDEMIKKL